MRFTHVLNPFRPATAQEASIHERTFESLTEATRFAPFPVQHLGVCDPQSLPDLPAPWEILPGLRRTLPDCVPLSPRRPLPLLADVLELAEGAKGEYLIFSNMDIAVLPHFYSALHALIEKGARSMVINRRWFESDGEPLPLLYSQIGRPHRGYDCFVFPRALLPLLDLGTLCLGIPWVGLGLFLNLRERGGPFYEFKDYHLTFHLGREQPWAQPQWESYRQHNRRELEGIRSRLEQDGLDGNHPWLEPVSWSKTWKTKWTEWAHQFSS